MLSSCQNNPAVIQSLSRGNGSYTFFFSVLNRSVVSYFKAQGDSGPKPFHIRSRSQSLGVTSWKRYVGYVDEEDTEESLISF